MKKTLGLFFLILILFSQDNLDQTNKRIQSLKEEIADLEVKNTELDAKKDNILYSLKAAYHRIIIARKNKELTEKTLSVIRLSIRQNRKKEKELKLSIKTTKKSYEKRLIDAYKVAPKSWFELLTESKSVDDFIRLMKYKEYIDEAEKRLLNKLKDDQKKLEEVIGRLKQSEKRQVSAVTAHNKSIKTLATEEKKLKRKLNSIQKNKKNLFAVIKQRRNERKKLEAKREELIKREKEKLRSAGRSEAEIAAEFKRLAKDFSKNKGRFTWPVKGKIIKPFGKVKIPQLKIYEQSTGIEIKSKRGTRVRTIFSGVVVLADFDSHGNTVIVSHGGGYFTVYSFLEDILVRKDQPIGGGEIIGTVGSSGTINGISRLHFELWSEARALNPMKWLK